MVRDNLFLKNEKDEKESKDDLRYQSEHYSNTKKQDDEGNVLHHHHQWWWYDGEESGDRLQPRRAIRSIGGGGVRMPLASMRVLPLHLP